METIIAQPEEKDQAEALKAVLKALKIKYVSQNLADAKSPYNPEFVDKILRGREEIRNGKGTKIKLEDLWK